MTFKVIIARPALIQIQEHYEYITKASPQNGAIWLEGIFDAIDSLETLPERCPISKHSKHTGTTVRFYVYERHIIDYLIDEIKNEVQVVSVWHSAQGAPPL
jgi:hypothetical protein